MEIVFHKGACSAHHSNMSTMILRAGSTGYTQACCAMYSLRMSFCTVPRSWSLPTPWRSAADVEAEQDRRRPVDRHRRRDLVERDAAEQILHVGERRDRDPAAP